MRRRIGRTYEHPVSIFEIFKPFPILYSCSYLDIPRLMFVCLFVTKAEDARAALDLFRSYEDPWEDEIRAGGWPCALPPSRFSRFFS